MNEKVIENDKEVTTWVVSFASTLVFVVVLMWLT